MEKKTFKWIKLAIEEQMPPFKTRECPRKLGIEKQILINLEYWQEYRIYFHIAGNWGVFKSPSVELFIDLKIWTWFKKADF